jgi:hypothetical protein
MFALPAATRDYIEVFSSQRADLATSYTTGPVVGLLVDDIVGAREELATAGVELIDEIQSPETMDGYRWFHFRGPDGNVYAIVEGSSALTS